MGGSLGDSARCDVGSKLLESTVLRLSTGRLDGVFLEINCTFIVR